ncbi:MAG TPA: lycopene cyclase domain-containing protein [Chloroflexota bacterium]|nr:lycopene cyclase domain-containing protein [Chloroflexota bacterium]
MTHLTYLLFELGWALPVLILQWLVGRTVLRRHLRPLLISIGIATVYLSLADAFAIAHGIWALHESRILGVRIGDLPIEESIFFLATNAMVAQSIVLIHGAGELRWIPGRSRRAA